MKATCKILESHIESGRTKITFLLSSNEINQVEKLKGQILDLEVNKHREKRSLNANAYAWEIMTKIGNVLRASKEDIYLDMLKKYGQSQLISVQSNINVSKFLKYYEEAGVSYLKGTRFVHYKVYTGTSEYDTKEMSIFIDGIVSEANELGIETMTPAELKSLKESWIQ